MDQWVMEKSDIFVNELTRSYGKIPINPKEGQLHIYSNGDIILYTDARWLSIGSTETFISVDDQVRNYLASRHGIKTDDIIEDDTYKVDFNAEWAYPNDNVEEIEEGDDNK